MLHTHTHTHEKKYKYIRISIYIYDFPCGSVVRNLPANIGDMGLIPGSERSPGEGNRYPLRVFLPGKWIEEPGGLQSMGSQE